jgi:transcriptional regulator with XRE-family HTH domain
VYPILLALNNNPIQSRTDTALFSDRIRTLRLHRNITQHTLAASIGLSQGAISNLEAGRKSPSADLVVQIANVFGVTTDYLLQGTFLDEDLEIDGKLRG